MVGWVVASVVFWVGLWRLSLQYILYHLCRMNFILRRYIAVACDFLWHVKGDKVRGMGELS